MGELLQYWSDELASPFMEEVRLLKLLIPNAELRERRKGSREFPRSLTTIESIRVIRPCWGASKLLAVHIRWEERVLFPEIQRTTTTLQLDELVDQTHLVEERRSNSQWSPRRGELVRKRLASDLFDSSRDRMERLAIERWETEGRTLGGCLEASGSLGITPKTRILRGWAYFGITLRLGLPLILLSDENFVVSDRYDIYRSGEIDEGPQPHGARTIFALDVEGRVACSQLSGPKGIVNPAEIALIFACMDGNAPLTERASVVS